MIPIQTNSRAVRRNVSKHSCLQDPEYQIPNSDLPSTFADKSYFLLIILQIKTTHYVCKTRNPSWEVSTEIIVGDFTKVRLAVSFNMV